MVTRIRARGGSKRRRLFIAEWMAYRELDDATLAGRIEYEDKRGGTRIGVDRVTVTRWRNNVRRPKLEMQAALAKALETTPDRLWGPPPPAQTASRPSLDALLRGKPDETAQHVAEMVKLWLRTGT